MSKPKKPKPIRVVCGLYLPKLTVLCIIEPGKKPWFMPLRDGTFDSLLVAISETLSTLGDFNLRVAHSGMGMMLAEKLSTSFGSRVEGIDMTLPQKDALTTETYVQATDGIPAQILLE